MTTTHHHKPDAQTVAEAVRDRMFENDAVSRGLGMNIEVIGPGYARVTMVVRPDMVNGFGLCHGGVITTLADTAFAFACNSHNELTLASGIFIEILNPGHVGDRIAGKRDFEDFHGLTRSCGFQAPGQCRMSDNPKRTPTQGSLSLK